MTPAKQPVDHLPELTIGMMQRYAETGNILPALEWSLPQILQEMRAQAGSFFLANDATKCLECVVCEGPVDIKGFTVPYEKGLVGSAYQNLQGFLTENANQDEHHDHSVDAKTGFLTQSMLTVPVYFSDQKFGCLQAINRVNETGVITIFSEFHLEQFKKLAVVLGVAMHNVNLAKELVQDALLKKDVKAAEDAQTNLFPDLGSFDCIVGKVIPARNLSGDFVDYLEIGSNIIFCQGDVSGKGVPAALTVARCLALFRYFAKQGIKPLQIAKFLNNEIFEMAERLDQNSGFVTLFVGSFNPVTQKLEYVNCGHGEAFVLGTNGQVDVLPSGSPPIGIESEATFSPVLESISLKDRRLCVFTDGVSEAKLNGVEIGFSGVLALYKILANLPITTILEKFMALFSQRKLVTSDDATLMIVG